MTSLFKIEDTMTEILKNALKELLSRKKNTICICFFKKFVFEKCIKQIIQNDDVICELKSSAF